MTSDKQKEMAEAVKQILDSTPNFVGLDPEAYVNIRWGQTGVGWGGFYIFEKDGKVCIETESMGKEFVKKMLCHMIDEAEVVD